MRKKREMQQRKEASSQVVKSLYFLNETRNPIDNPVFWPTIF